jgi:hypothetical protein
VIPANTTKCSTCQAEIFWAVTENDKRMPVDAKPQKRLVLEHRGSELPPLARVVDTFVSHFATCAQAAQHRKPPEAAPAARPKAR